MPGNTETWTVLFTDLVDSTDLRIRIGESAFDRFRQRHDQLLRACIVGHLGEVVKLLGDGVMAAFSAAADAVEAAVAIQQRFERWQHADADAAATAVRVGLSIGDAQRSDGDLHGLVVVEAARLCAAAQPGRILCAELIHQVSARRSDRSFSPRGLVPLKGLSPLDVCELEWEPLAAEPPGTSDGAFLRLPFVGRRRERAVFTAALEQATQGRGSVLLFEGEQGCGKSRLLAELGDQCQAAGIVLLEGRAFDAEGTPPFWIWRAPLTQLSRMASARAVTSMVDPLAAPELAAIRDGRPAPPGRPTNHLAVFDALAQPFVGMAETRPTVVLLDDLHWADMASLEFLAYLCRNLTRCGLVVVGTWCPEIGDRQAAGLLAPIERSTAAMKMALDPLGSADVSAMLTDASDPVVGRLVDATGGNAFLITELIRLADGHPIGDPFAVPPSVRSIVDARLAGLPAPVLELVEAASVLGRRGPLAMLAAVLGRTTAEVAVDADDAGAAGLLTRSSDGSFAFRHALVRQAVAARLTARRAADLHLAAARALDSGHAIDDQWAIAHHLTMASRVHTTSRAEATEAWRRAAQRAAAMGAHADAAAHLEEAVAMASEDDRSQLLVDLGAATLRAGRPAEALEHFAAASVGADPGVLAAAALGYEDAYLASATIRLSGADPSIELLTRALDVQPSISPARASLAGALARASWYSGDRDAAAQWLDRAELMVRSDDVDGRTRTAFARRVLAGTPGAAAQLADACTTLIDAATASGRHDVAVDALRQRVLSLIELGELAEADDEIERFERLVHLKGEIQYLPYAPLLRAMRMLQSGDLQPARRLTQRAAELGERIDSLHMAQLTLMQRFALSRWAGTPGRHTTRLLRHAGPTGSNTIWYAAAALDEGDNGNHQDARDLLRRGLGAGIERVPINEFWIFCVCIAAVASDRAHDPQRAALIYPQLVPYRHLIIGNVAPIVGPVSYAAGVAALCAGDLADAESLLHDACRRAEELQCWPWMVDALRAQVRLGDAQGHHVEALAERAEALARRLEMTAVASGQTDTAIASLTSRELEVLGLVAAGHSNREIAEMLFISYRTAKTHVSNLLTKLGARDRADAAIRARRAGLDASAHPERPGTPQPH